MVRLLLLQALQRLEIHPKMVGRLVWAGTFGPLERWQEIREV